MLQTLTPGERFGLRIAGVATLVFVAVIALMVVPENGILRDPVQHGHALAVYQRHRAANIFSSLSCRWHTASPPANSPPADLPQLMIEPMKDGRVYRDGLPAGAVRGDVQLEQHGQFMAVGLTDLLEFRHERCSGVCRPCAARLFCMFIASARPSGRFWRRSSCQCCCWLSPAFAQILFRIADSSVLPLAPVSPFVPLFLGFHSATGRMPASAPTTRWCSLTR